MGGINGNVPVARDLSENSYRKDLTHRTDRLSKFKPWVAIWRVDAFGPGFGGMQSVAAIEKVSFTVKFRMILSAGGGVDQVS